MNEREENQRPDDPSGKPGKRRKPDDTRPRQPSQPDPKGGIGREVGDLEDPDAEGEEGALPGRVGGGLAGG